MNGRSVIKMCTHSQMTHWLLLLVLHIATATTSAQISDTHLKYVPAGGSLNHPVEAQSNGVETSVEAEAIQPLEQQAAKSPEYHDNTLRFLPSNQHRCPERCTCSQRLRLVNCEHKKLTSIPADIPVNVTTLLLGYNALSSLLPNSFSNLTSLTELSLKNNLLVDIRSGAFAGLTALKFLFLTANSLGFVPPAAFEGLVSLEKLYLSQNQLMRVPDVGPCTSLKILGLENNKIVNAFVPDSFKRLKSFNRLTLNTNPITDLTIQTFEPLRHVPVTTIELGVCQLTNVEFGTFAGLQSLKSLVLSSNAKLSLASLQNIMDSLENSTLESLDISSSVQTTRNIPEYFFRGLNNVPLVKLKMRHHKLVEITNRTLQYLHDVNSFDLSFGSLVRFGDGALSPMVKLKTLIVNNNNLVELPVGLPQALQFADLNQNRYLSTIGVGIFTMCSNLQTLNLANCGIVTIAEKAFVGMEHLTHLDLSHNKIGNNNIGVKTFAGVPQLATLDLSHNQIRSIPTEAHLFMYATGLVELDMSHNNLHNFSHELFHGLNRLEHLDLSGNSLTKMLQVDLSGDIFSNLTRLVSLDLSHSDIITLPVKVFQGLTSLQVLNLSSNVIKAWEGSVFKLANLKALDMSANNIATVNESSVAALNTLGSNLTLDLLRNPFDCYCELRWFRGWMNTTNVMLANVNDYSCAAPTNMVGTKVLDFKPDTFTLKLYCHLSLSISLAVCIPIIFLIIIFICCCRKRFKFQMWWYRTFKKRKGGKYERFDNEYLATMFYFHTNKDSDIDLVEKVLDKCEEEGLPRDKILHQGNDVFCLGEHHMKIVDDLLTASGQGIKVIVVLSVRFLDDAFSRYQLNELRMTLIKKTTPATEGTDDVISDCFSNMLLILLTNQKNPIGKLLTKMPASLRRRHEAGNNSWEWQEEDQGSQDLCSCKLVDLLKEGEGQRSPDAPDEGSDSQHQNVGNIQEADPQV